MGIRFENRGQGELPIFHAAGKCPRMRYGVEYHAIDRDKGDQAAVRGKKKPSSGLTGPVKESPSPAEYYAPLHLTLEAEIKVPSRALYRSEIERVLRRFLHSSDLFDETVVADLKQDDEMIQNEIFGPVITVQQFSDEAQALDRAGLPDSREDKRREATDAALSTWNVLRALQAPHG